MPSPRAKDQLPKKILKTRQEKPFELFRDAQETIRILQTIAIALGFPLEVEEKSILLKTPCIS